VRTQKLTANHKSPSLEAVSRRNFGRSLAAPLCGEGVVGVPKGELTNEVGKDRARGPGLSQFKYHTIKYGVHRKFLVGHSLVKVISGVSDSSLFIFI
jgi:hypothetical protein